MKCCCFNNTNNSNEKNEKISLPIWCYSVAIVKKRLLLLLLLWSVLSLALAHTQTHNADVLGIWIQSIAREWEEEFFHKRNVRANFCHLLDHTLVRLFVRSLALCLSHNNHRATAIRWRWKSALDLWYVCLCVSTYLSDCLFVCLQSILYAQNISRRMHIDFLQNTEHTLFYKAAMFLVRGDAWNCPQLWVNSFVSWSSFIAMNFDVFHSSELYSWFRVSRFSFWQSFNLLCTIHLLSYVQTTFEHLHLISFFLFGAVRSKFEHTHTHINSFTISFQTKF